MAEIKTSSGGYKRFIGRMRAAFRNQVPLVAFYPQEADQYVRFHYIVQAGNVANLYLTQISQSQTANGAALANRVLGPAELAYGHDNIGNINKGDFEKALKADFTAGGAWNADLKKKFDIVLLCTVEAARSKFIYSQVINMLTVLNKSVDGDLLKEVAQMYGHSQEAANHQQFKPLDELDYRALYYQDKEKGNVDLGRFNRMGIR